MHSTRFAGSREEARAHVAAALEAMEPVAVYAEDDGRFRAKTGSYGLGTQGYELEVLVEDDDGGATVTATADYVLSGRWSVAPRPELYAELFGAHLERAVADDARPTGEKRVESVGSLDGMALPSGRTVPIGVYVGLLVVASGLFVWPVLALGWVGSVVSASLVVLYAAASMRHVRARKREVACQPNSADA